MFRIFLWYMRGHQGCGYRGNHICFPGDFQSLLHPEIRAHDGTYIELIWDLISDLILDVGADLDLRSGPMSDLISDLTSDLI